MSKEKTLSVKNAGPIEELSFKIENYGVTILVAKNGSGKSILLKSIQDAAKGKGKIPLRDGTKKGSLEICGATISIGASTRHSGEFEVSHLEGKLNLSTLIDPGIKTPELCDAARIKAIVSLTGVEANPELFTALPEFSDWASVLDDESLATDDLVEMARRIKADYDKAARAAEAEADRESGRAAGTMPPADIDLNQEHDSVKLQEAYDTARDTVTRIEERLVAAQRNQKKLEVAQAELNQLTSEGAPEVDYDEELQLERAVQNDLISRIADLKEKLTAAENAANLSQERIESIQKLKEAGASKQAAIEACKRIISENSDIVEPSTEELAKSRAVMFAAKERVEQGAVIRDAISRIAQAKQHQAASVAATKLAAKHREAGKATDDVLSSVIETPHLRIESDGEKPRLMVNGHKRGKNVLYHDLSAGEKARIAIDIGVDQVGEDGLLVIDQESWEGIDTDNRILIDQHAKSRKVYILTAEAKHDPQGEETLQRQEFGS